MKFCNMNDYFIEKYEIIDNKILITFLSQVVKKIPYSLENERTIIKIMQNQAKQRNESSTIIKNLEDERFSKFGICVGSATLSLYNFLFAFFENNEIIENFAMFAGVAFGIGIYYFGKQGFDAHNKITELKKYNLYLSIMKKLEMNENPHLLDGIVEPERELSINTLDSYSLSDIKKLNRRLQQSN